MKIKLMNICNVEYLPLVNLIVNEYLQYEVFLHM